MKLRCIMVSTLVLITMTSVGADPATADVRGDVRLTAERPVSGTFDLDYNNYGEKFQTCDPEGICTEKGYKVARGTLKVKLRTYRLVEEVDKFDYYVLDVDVVNADRYGRSKRGWAKVHVTNVGRVRLIDHSDTTSVSASEPDCVDVNLSMGQSVGPASASVDWGSVRFCEKGAKYVVEKRTGDTTTYLASHTREISHFSSQRIVKVRRGKRPKFKVSVHVPTDDCTSTYQGDCDGYENDTRLESWRIRA